MMLQEIIKADMKAAMKARDTAKLSLLRVIVGDISTISKAKDRPSPLVQDDEVISLLKTMKDNAVSMGNTDEVKIIDTYLPSMIGEKQLEVIISAMIHNHGYSGMKDMGNVMAKLKSNYPGSYDGKIASQIVRNKL